MFIEEKEEGVANGWWDWPLEVIVQEKTCLRETFKGMLLKIMEAILKLKMDIEA